MMRHECPLRMGFIELRSFIDEAKYSELSTLPPLCELTVRNYQNIEEENPHGT